MAGSLTDAMGKLKNTIETINNKIVEGKGKVQEYKTQLIVRLQALNAQIKSLNFEGILSIVPKLKKELEESKYNLKVQTEQLVDATTELSQQKAKLEEQNKQIESLTREIDNLTQEIEAKKQEVDKLNNENGQKESQIKDLNEEIKQLNNEKTAAEQKLTDAQNELSVAKSQIDNFIQEINSINESLKEQIKTIDQISSELGNVDQGDVNNKITEIADSIAEIMGMINSQEGGPRVASEESSSSNMTVNDIKDLTVEKLVSLSPDKKKTVIKTYNTLPINEKIVMLNTLSSELSQESKNTIEKIIGSYNENPNDQMNIDNITNAFTQIINKIKRGGKRNKKRKTMKKRNRKTKKILSNGNKLKNRHVLRGGYVYSSSKELDRTSSVINGLSKSRKSPNSKKKSRRSG